MKAEGQLDIFENSQLLHEKQRIKAYQILTVSKSNTATSYSIRK